MRSSTLRNLDRLIDEQEVWLSSAYTSLTRLEERMTLAQGTDQYNVLGVRFDNLFFMVTEGEMKLSSLVQRRNQQEWLEEQEDHQPEPF